MESQLIVLVKSLCENFESELKVAFRFCEGLQVPQEQYEGKIIYPNMAKEFIAYLDNQGFFTNQKCFILTDNIKNKDRLLYLSAVLNSKTNFWYFKQIGATLGANGYEMSKIFVEKLPVIETHKIDSTLLKEIENLASEILESKEADSNSSVADLESHLDSLIYKAYGLNENEINLIESELSTRERERIEIIEKLYHLLESFVRDSEEDFRASKVAKNHYQGKIMWNRISSELCFSYDEAGYYILDSMFMITSENEFVIKYLLSILNSNLSKHWIKNNAATLGDGVYGAKIYIEKLPIPTINAENQIIVDEIINLVDNILESKAKDSTLDTSKLESQIDCLVYALYELNSKEIQIIRGE